MGMPTQDFRRLENTMNEKTAKQIKNLKKQTIGVEIEMNHITRERAARLAADHFGTGRYEYTASRNGYSTWSAWDARRRRYYEVLVINTRRIYILSLNY